MVDDIQSYQLHLRLRVDKVGTRCIDRMGENRIYPTNVFLEEKEVVGRPKK